MLDQLISYDKSLLLFLNSHYNAVSDAFWWATTNGWTFVPLYLVWFWAYYKRFDRQFFWILLLIGIQIALTDLTSVHLFKNVFCRLRPSHDPELASLVHIVNDYRGGLYGFVSSHAANTVGIATLTSLLMQNRWYTLSAFVWAALMSYSRIALGVHYPIDILCGALLGFLIALGVRAAQKRWLLLE